MKKKFIKATLLLSGLLAGSTLFAQTVDSTMTKEYIKPFSDGSAFRRFSIGINGGLLTPYTIFRGHDDFATPNEEIGYGGFLKYQILPSFGLQANFLRGYVQGTNAADGTVSKFRTNLKYAADLSANFTVANISWRSNRSFIQPYLIAGGGLMGFTTVLTNPDGSTRPFKTDGSNISQFYIPVGVGIKFNLSPVVNLDLGYQVNFVDGDNFDGLNFGTNNDKFSYAHIGLEFALGKSSKPQLATHNPVSSMRTEYLMHEIAIKNQLQAEIDAQKAANDQLRNDLNTTNANLAKFTADSDGDGVADFYDKCPGTPAGTKVDGSGCPLPVAQNVKVYVTEEDRKVVKEAIRNLEFDFGKATIRDHSLPSLDKVAQLLVDKNFSLKLAGHTDNVGSADGNLKLSKDRAEAIKTYLVSKGANPSRIEAVGYGKTQPIATNKTAAGRQLNRRVEFTLF